MAKLTRIEKAVLTGYLAAYRSKKQEDNTTLRAYYSGQMVAFMGAVSAVNVDIYLRLLSLEISQFESTVKVLP